MQKYYALINKLTTKPGKRDEVISLLIESGKPFYNNPSCIHYLVYEDTKNPDVIWVEDVWKNKKDHAAALAKPGIKLYIKNNSTAKWHARAT